MLTGTQLVKLELVLNPYVYLKTQPKEVVLAVTARAGISYGFFRQVAHGHKVFSTDAAINIEEATRHYAGNETQDIITAAEALGLDKLIEDRLKEMRDVA